MALRNSEYLGIKNFVSLSAEDDKRIRVPTDRKRQMQQDAASQIQIEKKGASRTRENTARRPGTEGCEEKEDEARKAVEVGEQKEVEFAPVLIMWLFVSVCFRPRLGHSPRGAQNTE
ncbi:hypothetical protein AcV7_006521 [Taiwanofungus camphoratus]|nr:hypothetical protein AcV7_006521 [Antrodia cinnamomea]